MRNDLFATFLKFQRIILRYYSMLTYFQFDIHVQLGSTITTNLFINTTDFAES